MDDNVLPFRGPDARQVFSDTDIGRMELHIRSHLYFDSGETNPILSQTLYDHLVVSACAEVRPGHQSIVELAETRSLVAHLFEQVVRTWETT